MKCYFRFNANYAPNQNQSNQRNGIINVNMAQVQTDTSIQSENNRISNQDVTTRSEHIQDESWYPDSGATNHITSNLDN